ncbi:hypothetical protein [Flagellimonas myxillae]|uniref:hypothetical protein n=1 Tax=Flagellimonas myxillae TaxID=2942214 RepID=UPI00201F60B5|nr:hypothetical protein [Muricauda myxillae]MCL6266063.1 hypothetical protein [Muricauda myxillae]
MISFLPKRLAVLASLVLTIGMLTPSVIKLAHTFHGHAEEEHCVSYGTNHFHDIEVDCDFQDFNTVSKVFFATFGFDSITTSPLEYHNTLYSFLFIPFKGEQVSLRGPPVVS